METEFEKICECDLQFVGLDSSIGILGRIQLEGKNTKADIALGLDTNLVHIAKETGYFAELPSTIKDIHVKNSHYLLNMLIKYSCHLIGDGLDLSLIKIF